MAVFNLEYYKGTDLYSDGDIENEILDIVKSKNGIDNTQNMKFPVLYHLSKVRENILNWYPFSKEARILEIGSGCGALTGLLCDRAKSVTSVELSKRRATINFERNKHKNNLEIIVGNQNDMIFPELFDYVVLNGVYEYAMSFTKGEEPYEQFLSFVAGFLKPNGRILIAIENKLGIKYFAGAPEDHTNAYFDGLNQYPDNDVVRTFSKKEWIALMERCGLYSYRFYYPYPDYKFPKEIFTDETVNQDGFGRNEWNFTEHRLALFNEEKVVQNLIEEGIADRFANSFLIDMGRTDEGLDNRVIYAKLNRDRADSFAIATVIEKNNGGLQVVKKPLEEQAIPHLKKMNARWTEEGLITPFLKGNSLGILADEKIRLHDVDAVKEYVRLVWDECLQCGSLTDAYSTVEFQRVFGQAALEGPLFCVNPANIDLILENIFQTAEGLEIIDCEWCFDFAIPRQFILWRTINELYSKNIGFEQIYPREVFLAEYDIDQSMAKVFWQWSTFFAEEYVKANRILTYSKEKVEFSLETVRQERIRQKDFTGGLYLDTGNGFSEKEKLVLVPKDMGGVFFYEIDLSDVSSLKALRFDPIEGSPSACRVVTAGDLTFSAANAAFIGEEDIFLTADPVYNVTWKTCVPTKVTFEVSIRKLEMAEVLQYVEKLNQKKPSWKFWRK